MRTAMERLEAQGPSPGPVRLARRTKLGLANPAKEPIARLLAPPGAPFPRLKGKRKKGRRARPGARNQNHGTAERWLFDNQIKNATARAKINAYRDPRRGSPRRSQSNPLRTSCGTDRPADSAARRQ